MYVCIRSNTTARQSAELFSSKKKYFRNISTQMRPPHLLPPPPRIYHVGVGRHPPPHPLLSYKETRIIEWKI